MQIGQFMQIGHSLIQAYAAVTSEKTEVGETQMFVSMCNDLPVLLPLKRLLQRQGLQLLADRRFLRHFCTATQR